MSHKVVKLNDLGQVIYEHNKQDMPLHIFSDSPDWFSSKMYLGSTAYLEWNKNTVTYYFNDNNEMEKVLQKIRVDRFENIGFVENMTDDLKVGIEINCVDVRDNKAFFLEKKEDTFKVKSRIEILDDLAIKFGKKDDCESFENYCSLYNHQAVVLLVRQAMAEYELQTIMINRKNQKDTFNKKEVVELLKKHTQFITDTKCVLTPEEDLFNDPLKGRIFNSSDEFIDKFIITINK
jgi:hypothetical protein